MESQILHEIDWFLAHNSVKARAMIAYDRVALFGREDQNLRITFDRNIRWRDTMLDLSVGDQGQYLTNANEILMEIKIPGSMPIWLAQMLSQLSIYPTSYSKYGVCYKENLTKEPKGDIICA